MQEKTLDIEIDWQNVVGSYISEINIMGAIVAGEPITVIPFTNAGVVETEAELFHRGALLVPECFPFWGFEAGQLLVALEAVWAENEVSVTRSVNKNVTKDKRDSKVS